LLLLFINRFAVEQWNIFFLESRELKAITTAELVLCLALDAKETTFFLCVVFFDKSCDFSFNSSDFSSLKKQEELTAFR